MWRCEPAGSVGRLWLSLLAATVLASGCTTARAVSEEKSPTAKPSQSASPSPQLPVSAAVTPADKATGVATGVDIGAAVTNGVVQSVELKANGKPVPGALLADGKTWRPGTQLAYSTTYSVAVTAGPAGGQTKTFTSAFTTMPKPSSRQIVGADLYFSDGDVVGTGMPLVVEFTKAIPAAFRAAVERRLSVSTTPAVVGSWYWHGGGSVHYRPEKYWAPGTKIALRVGIGGAPMGPGRFGKRDRIATITVGSSIYSRVDNAKKTMTVHKDGKLLRTMPVSLGRPKTPTASGIHVVMEKRPEMWMDSSTYGVPADAPGGYRQRVLNAVRYTWGGQFTHGAPWSVGDQGRRNVSHGCVNLSPSNARWFLELSKKGDVIEIVGTGSKVKPGDGWTDWNIPWAQYQAGSALK
jgi:lipoprotein-anchoring transpeptidase ErfK/SrfK